MLYEDFNAKTRVDGVDFFKIKASEKVEVLKNLNPSFGIRDYQKEALGRFYFYREEFHQKQKPIHLMFNMATGSGKTLIMAANMLYLYQQGYRNFIFFVRLDNIVQKTKDNFLNPSSKKYLFAQKIVVDGKEIQIRDVENFEGVNGEDINILFTTTAGLHSRFNFAHENSLTYEDFEDKKVVLIADEAHNLSVETTGNHAQGEEEERKNWELTVMKILNANPQKDNILLEFTATARLEQEYPEVLEKYKDKAIYRYDLKEYRLDGFSKDVRTLQINASMMDRVLSAVVISQYRRKVAEKHNLRIKPVILFKANRVTVPKKIADTRGANPQIVVSSEFKESFHKLIDELSENKLRTLTTFHDPTLGKVFAFFDQHDISLDDLTEEIKSDFAPEKCLTVDDNSDLEQKQLRLNSLEEQNNEIRAIFATEKLNEGWDVLNLFDIVRLYNSRDARENRPGKTTVQEAQLIGRGARYCPFTIGEFTDPYRRKFDSDTANELRILEQLYYHSVTNPRYIQELENVLVREGIMPIKTVSKELKIKDSFKESTFWKYGVVFSNSRKEYLGEKVFTLNDAGVKFDYQADWNMYTFFSGQALERDIFTGEQFETSQTAEETKEISLLSLGESVVRNAISRLPEYQFDRLKKILGNLTSIKEFITSKNYLGEVRVVIKGPRFRINNLEPDDKVEVALFVLNRIMKDLLKHRKEFIGVAEFTPKKISEVFIDKTLQLDPDNHRAQPMQFDFASKDWFAQNEIWGTSEEESLLHFMDNAISDLKERYEEIALIRNELFLKIYNFEDGLPFYPDFLLFLLEKESKQEVIYQVFIEPKGDFTLDSELGFEQSQEGWKQKLLLELEKNGKLTLQYENRQFRLIGLPFYNKGDTNQVLHEQFAEAFNEKLLG